MESSRSEVFDITIFIIFRENFVIYTEILPRNDLKKISGDPVWSPRLLLGIISWSWCQQQSFYYCKRSSKATFLLLQTSLPILVAFFRSQVTYLRAFLIYIKKIIRALSRGGGDPRDIVNATLSPNDFWNISGVQSERSIWHYDFHHFSRKFCHIHGDFA